MVVELLATRVIWFYHTLIAIGRRTKGQDSKNDCAIILNAQKRYESSLKHERSSGILISHIPMDIVGPFRPSFNAQSKEFIKRYFVIILHHISRQCGVTYFSTNLLK